MRNPRVGILTDSVADLPRSLIERFQVRVVPAYLMLDGQSYPDDGTLDSEWFYDQLRTGKRQLTTAAPPPGEFLAAYQAMVAEGFEEIVALLTASRVSSLYHHARVAARAFGEEYGSKVRLHLIDTQQVSMGMGWMVVCVGELIAQRVPADEIASRVRHMRDRTRIIGVLDSIDYLRRSGRVGWVAGKVASLLQIRPLIGFYRGEAQLLGRVRTYWRALRAMVERVREMVPLERLAILHSHATTEHIEQLQHWVSEMAPNLEVPIVDIGAVFATHVGPGCLGVALVAASPDRFGYA
ncbi:MAG: DegV family protein [Anaerolineae bacterium]